MLAARGERLLLAVGALATGGWLLAQPAALLVAAVVAGGVFLELRRLRSHLRPYVAPLGLRAQLRAPVARASTRALELRSHRVGQRVALELVLDVAPDLDGIVARPVAFVATDGMELRFDAPPQQPTHAHAAVVSVEARPAAAAIHRVFGVRCEATDAAGLVRADVFLPCPYEVAVLPRSWRLDARQLRETRRQVLRSAGGTQPDRVAGQGDELRELREHLPGDPFKHIAWKASARRGRLMSRVFEHERARAIFAVLDCGATMRDGVLGRAALDLGLDLCHSLAEAAARENLPLGLALVDGEVVDRTAVHEGVAALRQCDRALLDVRRVVAERLTPLPEEALLQLVVDHLGAVERVRLPPAKDSASWVTWRQRTVMAALARLPERERHPAQRGPEPSSRADLSILRRYCRAADIALPYRASLPPAERAEGLIAGLEVAGRAKKGPFAVLLISDFRGMRGHLARLWRAAAALRSAGHRVVLVSVDEVPPDLSTFAPEGEDADMVLGLMRADVAARAETLEALADGARRAGAGWVADPSPARVAALWAAGAFR